MSTITLVSGTITATGDGSTFLRPLNRPRWTAYIKCGTVTGTSPTLDLKIQHSMNGSNWTELVTFTQITASNAQEPKQLSTATDYLKPLYLYLRATYTVGGTDTPTFNSVVVQMVFEG